MEWSLIRGMPLSNQLTFNASPVTFVTACLLLVVAWIFLLSPSSNWGVNTNNRFSPNKDYTKYSINDISWGCLMFGCPVILAVHESCDPLIYCVVKVNPTALWSHDQLWRGIPYHDQQFLDYHTLLHHDVTNHTVVTCRYVHKCVLGNDLVYYKRTTSILRSMT